MRTYSFRDEWEVAAPPAQVWALIEQPETYPLWWPIYREARVVEDNGPVGSVAALKFRVLLPYTLTVTTRSTRSEAPHLLEGTVSGELEGTWRWTLRPSGDGTEVAFEETVRTNRWILDLLGPVANRLFALNHRIAARKGAEGMRAYLARPGAGAQGAANLRQSAHSGSHGALRALSTPPPGSSGMPFFGESFALAADPFAFVRERAARHGAVARSRLPGRDLALLSGPQTADAFLDEANVRRAGVMPRHVAALFGAGVVNQIDAAAHRARKQHLMRALDQAALAQYLPQIRALLRARMARWHAAGQVSMQQETVLATLELVLANFTSLSDTDAVYTRYAKGFADIAQALFGLPVALPGTALARAQAFVKELRQRLAAVVAERRRSPTGDGVSRLIASEVEGARLMDEDIVNEMVHLASAGGGIWGWCCLGVKALADDPGLRERLRQAVAALEPQASARALGEVALLDAFVREVKRVGPIFPFTAFGVAKRKFTVAGHTIPEGWLVTWSTHASHVVDGVAPYTHPETFDAGRFLPPRGEGAAPHAFAPQGPGPALASHRCAGVEYSTLVLQVFFAELLRGPHFALPEQDFRLDGSFVPARYRGGMQVRFESGPHAS